MEYSMKDKPVILLLSEKGGVGKSTISNVVAQILHSMLYYKKIQYVNFDKKQDYRKKIVPDWIEFTSILDDSIDLEIKDVMEALELDACVIDSGGYEDRRIKENLLYVDTIIIPTTPDDGSTLMIKEIFKDDDYREQIGKKNIVFVINQYNDNSKLANFDYVKQQIIKNALKPLDLNYKDFKFIGIKRSDVPLRINSIEPDVKITVQDIMEKPNAAVYKPFVGAMIDIAMNINKSIEEVNEEGDNNG